MTMNCIDIDSSQHELYDSWRKLYTVSFPIFEQRTQEQQEKAFSCADYHLIAKGICLSDLSPIGSLAVIGI